MSNDYIYPKLPLKFLTTNLYFSISHTSTNDFLNDNTHTNTSIGYQTNTKYVSEKGAVDQLHDTFRGEYTKANQRVYLKIHFTHMYMDRK